MARPAARTADCTGCNAKLIPSQSTVFIDGREAICFGDYYSGTRKGHQSGQVVPASSVLVDGRPIAHVGSACTCGCVVATGSSVVFIV